MAAIQNIMKTKYYFYLNINFYYGKDIQFCVLCQSEKIIAGDQQEADRKHNTQGCASIVFFLKVKTFLDCFYTVCCIRFLCNIGERDEGQTYMFLALCLKKKDTAKD